MKRFQSNPWQVVNIDVFHLWCCPECKYQCPQKPEFEDHALKYHPKSSVLIRRPTIKTEPIDSDQHDYDLPYHDSTLLEVNLKELDQNPEFHQNLELNRNPEAVLIKQEINSPIDDDNHANIGEKHELPEVEDDDDDPLVNDNGKESCPFCQKTFLTKIDKKNHMLAKHRNKNTGHLLPVICGNCSETFVNPFNAKPQSFCSKCNNSNYECAYCDEEFATKPLRLQHEETKHRDQNKKFLMVECQYCQEVISSSVRLRIHIIQKHGGEPTLTVERNTVLARAKPGCVICNKQVENEADLERHIDEHKTDNECAFCSARFKHDQDRDRHEEKDHQEEPQKLSCKFCCIMNLTPEELREHVKLCHKPVEVNINMGYKCRICRQIFYDEAKYHDHELSHKKSTMCVYCLRDFDSDVVRNSHERRLHITKYGVLQPIKCWYCTYMAKSSIHLRKHFDEKHPELTEKGKIKNVFKCPFCNDEAFNTTKELQEHITRHNTEQCAYCKRNCLPGPNLELHEKEFHTDEFGELLDLKCTNSNCKRIMKSTRAMREHFNEYHRVRSLEEIARTKIWKCCICDKAFTDRQAMRYHRENHKEEVVEKLICQYCGHEAYGKNMMRTHMRNVHDTKKYECAECGAKFPTKNALLRIHKCALNQKTRQQNQPHPCPSCDEILYSKLKMVKHHYMTHGIMPAGFEDKKVFECEQCPQVFFAEENLERHIKSDHTKLEPVKLFDCDRCDKKLKNKKGLYSHYMVVHKLVHEDCKDKDQFYCEFCPAVYNTKISLQCHLKKHSDPRTASRKRKRIDEEDD